MSPRSWTILSDASGTFGSFVRVVGAVEGDNEEEALANAVASKRDFKDGRYAVIERVARPDGSIVLASQFKLLQLVNGPTIDVA